jgi:hypothetical protein
MRGTLQPPSSAALRPRRAELLKTLSDNYLRLYRYDF